MEQILKIGDKEVRINNSVAWVLEYREQFGEDILPAIMPLFSTLIETTAAIVDEAATVNDRGEKVLNVEDVLKAVEGRTLDLFLPLYQSEFTKLGINVLWSMAKVADPTIEPPKTWLLQFDTFPVDEVIPEAYKFLASGVVSSKNLKRLTNLKKTIKKSQP